MSIAVTCPQCRTEFEVPPDLVDQPVRCQRCGHAFPAHVDGIQVGATSKRPVAEDIDAESMPSPRRPMARAAFPWGPVAIITIGILFLLLAFSAGLNFWLIFMPDQERLAMEDAMRAQQMAMEERRVAEQARQRAMAQEAEAQVQLQRMQQQLAAARKQLDDANAEVGDLPDRQPPDWGSLEGRVTWKGELPKPENLFEKKNFAPDIRVLLAKAPPDQLLDPTWRVDPKTKGVANVCVYFKRPIDGSLPIHRDDTKKKSPVVMDAPFLIFTPHMVALYPEWFDGVRRGKTGQRFILKNSSPYTQNQRITSDFTKNDWSNRPVASLRQEEYVLNAQALPLSVSNDVPAVSHAYIWVFDHPYYAITNADGTFTIPRVPAGLEVHVMAWHEAQGWLFTKDGKAMTLKAGKNTLDFEMSAK